MNKALLWVCIGIGGLIGGYVPVLFGADALGGWSILGGTLGSIVGIFAAYRVNQWLQV